MTDQPTPAVSAQARKAALTRHHGATHPATLAAAAAARNAQLAAAIQQALTRSRP